MSRFDETKLPQKEIYGDKTQIKIWDVDCNNILISKLVETKNNSKYLVDLDLNSRYYLDIRSLVLIMPKLTGYVKIF